MLKSFVTAQRSFSRPLLVSKALTSDACPSSILFLHISPTCEKELTRTDHCTAWADFSRRTLTVVQENRTIEGKPNVGSIESFNQAWVFGSESRRHCPLQIVSVRNAPEGYPLPRSAVHSWFDATELPAAMFSSNDQPPKQASRVTLAATLAAPTILNLESAFEVTVKFIPGNSLDKYASYVVVVPSAST